MSDKPLLFLLPGLMCDETVWLDQRDALAAHAEVIIPVFRGFDSLVDMATHVLDQASGHFSVVGHSMGGRVAWELMSLAPERIERFCVMDTGVHPVSPDEPGKRQVLVEKAISQGLNAVAEAWIGPMLHPDRQGDTALLECITDMILRNTVEDFLGQVKALLERKDQSAGLSRIEHDVFLIAGEEDGWSPPSQHREIAAQLKHSQLEIVAGAGHMVTMEKPREVNTLLTQWFTANEK